jgi:signal transduction histidine kinase
VKLYAVPVVSGGRRVGTVVTGLSLEPYERTASRALVASLAFAAAAFLLIVVATRWAISRSLRPVAMMTAEAETWSERDLDHSFNAGEPTDELTRLAATFDSMFARLATSLRREQRFSAEISHELRTPLTAIVAESELALARHREPDEYRRALQTIADRARQLQRALDTLVSAARAETSPQRGTADAEHVAANAVDACSALAAERGLAVAVAPTTEPVRAGVDGDAAERILLPLVENACTYAHSRVDVSVHEEDSAVEFIVRDDGPGVAPEERERIFEPGARGSAARNEPHGGAGLGLALARRLARAVDGDVDYRNGSVGATFVASLPRA